MGSVKFGINILDSLGRTLGDNWVLDQLLDGQFDCLMRDPYFLDFFLGLGRADFGVWKTADDTALKRSKGVCVFVV
jgi:hypothetical protein